MILGDRWDVVVAGGGPAGSIAALVLARAGRRVLLVDASSGPPRAGETLPSAARPLLRDLDLVSAVFHDGHLPCTANASAWGSDDLHHSHAVFNVYGGGLHLERSTFDASLRATAAAAGAHVVNGTLAVGRDTVCLRTEGREEPLRCRWLVDATGRSASVARARGAARIVDDRLVAFHARFVPAEGSDDTDGRLLVEACADGWWYTARSSSGERTVAFLTDADLVERRALLSSDGFAARLAQTVHVQSVIQSAGCAMSRGPRGIDASGSRLDRFAGDGWIAIGDAALTFDPLSSQGIFNAIYTGMRAGQALTAAFDGRHDAVSDYACELEDVRRAYARNVASFYALETRWPQNAFWRRRLTIALPARVR